MPNAITPRSSLAATLLTAALTLAAGPARAEVDPSQPLPCRGDACGNVLPGARTPLLVPAPDPTQPGQPAPEYPPPSPPPSGYAPVYPAPPKPTPGLKSAGSDVPGTRLSFGRAFTRGITDGWYGRVDLDVFELVGGGLWSHTGPGMVGIKLGLEGWGSVDGGGGGIPWGFEGGVAIPFTQSPRSVRFVLTGCIGWEWAHYDRTRHVGQFGIFAPLAETHLGLDFRGIRLLGQASAQYRWGWGDIDRAQYRVGASLSFNAELGRSSPR